MVIEKESYNRCAGSPGTWGLGLVGNIAEANLEGNTLTHTFQSGSGKHQSMQSCTLMGFLGQMCLGAWNIRGSHPWRS